MEHGTCSKDGAGGMPKRYMYELVVKTVQEECLNATCTSS